MAAPRSVGLPEGLLSRLADWNGGRKVRTPQDTAPPNGRGPWRRSANWRKTGRGHGKCHRNKTAPLPHGGGAKVKRWCKRPPVPGASRGAGKPRREQDRAAPFPVRQPPTQSVGDQLTEGEPVIRRYPEVSGCGAGRSLDPGCETGTR